MGDIALTLDGVPLCSGIGRPRYAKTKRLRKKFGKQWESKRKAMQAKESLTLDLHKVKVPRALKFIEVAIRLLSTRFLGDIF